MKQCVLPRVGIALAVCALVLTTAFAATAAEQRNETQTPAPAAYVMDGVQHIFYRTSNGDLMELFHRRGEESPAWHSTNLTSATNAPKAASNPAAYFTKDDNTQHVVFRGADNQIHELFLTKDVGKWSHNNLSMTAKAPQAAGDPAALARADDKSQHVYFRTAEGGIYELFNTRAGGAKGWNGVDISSAANAPKAASDPCGFMVPSRGRPSLHVFYRGSDDQIHELSYTEPDKKWAHNNLSSGTNAPKAAGAPDAAFMGKDDTGHVFFRTSEGGIAELFIKLDAKELKWALANPSQMANAPKAAGDPATYVWADTRREHVVYRGSDDQIHELFYSPENNKWLHNNLSEHAKAPKATGDPTGYYMPEDKTQHVIFVAADGNLIELVQKTDVANAQWTMNNLTGHGK